MNDVALEYLNQKLKPKATDHLAKLLKHGKSKVNDKIGDLSQLSSWGSDLSIEHSFYNDLMKIDESEVEDMQTKDVNILF